MTTTAACLACASAQVKAPVSDHFDGERFFNPNGQTTPGASGMLKWMATRSPGVWRPYQDFPPGPKPPERVEDMRVTFVNHATTLLQMDGLNLLTDPIWSKRCSPVAFAGPARKRPPGLRFDYALAQSIFSHCTQPLLRRWLAQLSTRLEDHGALFATFCVGERDCEGEGWVYPACVTYRPETIAAAAAEFGFRFEMLDWRHPRQAWALFSRPSYDQSLTSGGVVAWNRVVEKFSRQRSPAVERGT